MLANTTTAWGTVAKLFHWLIALMLLGLVVVGTYMTGLPDEQFEQKFQLYQTHKSFGLLAFVFIAARLAWRLVQPAPALPANSPAYVRLGSKLSHWGLYALMIVIPVSGYLMTSTNTFGIPTVAFGIVPIPHVLGPDAGLESLFKTIHDVAGSILILVVLIHIAAALKHAFIDKDGVLSRMWFGRQGPEAN